MNSKAIINIIITGLISGLCSFVFITFINSMLGSIISGAYQEIDYNSIFIFILILLCFLWSRRALAFKLIKLSQNLFWGLRARVIKMVLQSDYEQMSSRRDQIHSALVNDVGVLTQASLSIIEFITSSVVVIACLVYMAFLSFPLFIATLITATIGIFIYQLGARTNNSRFTKTRQLEDGFMNHFNSILRGFKEIFITPSKGSDIYSRKIRPISDSAFINNTKAFESFLNNQITGQILFYTLIGAVLLVFSVKMEADPITIVNFLFILLFLLGAIETLMVLLPGLLRAKVSLGRIRQLEKDLSSSIKSTQVDHEETKIIYDTIKVANLHFKYNDKEGTNGFEVGPINAEINKGDIVFIYGGNGSGKTTFVHALLGLLKSDEGSIHINGNPLTDENYLNYKNLFSVVYNDFYLFDEFYGNQNFDREKAKEYLVLFEVEDKVEVIETGFSKIDLSTGQRKRLALIEALLENNPIIILDEWAADQDPYFRKKFYSVILPKLKAEGFTIIAITHDDAYYENCDKLFKMEYGKLIDVKS